MYVYGKCEGGDFGNYTAACTGPRCRWWDERKGAWSEDGCSLLYYDATGALFSSTHLTHFSAGFGDVGVTQRGVFDNIHRISWQDVKVGGGGYMLGSSDGLALTPSPAHPPEQLVPLPGAAAGVCGVRAGGLGGAPLRRTAVLGAAAGAAARGELQLGQLRGQQHARPRPDGQKEQKQRPR